MLIAGLASLAGLILCSSCSTFQRTVVQPPNVAGAHYVGNSSCAECHTNIARAFPGSPHARFYKDDIKWAATAGCESCHGPGSEHVRVGGGRGKFIVNPGKDPSACFNCHLEVHAQFNLPQHHPVIENKMNCVQCHDPHGTDIMKPHGGLAMARLNENCAQCHREQTKPVVYEHEALREGCTVCHAPHGSINAKMLVERDVNLCLKCHAQVQDPLVGSGNIYIGKADHTTFLRQGTCWTSGCHTAIHGSNIDRYLRF